MIEFHGVDFAYGRRVPVFTDLDYRFCEGATVLLGPNGAGKSTLLALAASSLLPSRGHVSLGSLSSDRRQDRASFRRQVGWLPQRVDVVPGFSVREQVAYAGWLKGLSRADAWVNSAGALEQVALADLSDRPARQLSGGQLRRLAIAQTLVHDARVLLLDEPTAGLDPAQRHGFRDLIAQLSQTRSVIVSTHETHDLHEIYAAVVVLAEGRIRWSGSTPDFLSHACPGKGDRAELAYAELLRGAETP